MSRPASTTAPQPDQDDALNPKVAVSCLDFLLIELVPLAQRIADQLHAREQGLINDFKNSKIFSQTSKHNTSAANRDSGAPTATVTDNTTTGGDGTTTTATGTSQEGVMDDEMREAVFWRLDSLGYRVGQGLVERFSTSKPRPHTPLDSIKFICKDLWILLFRKQIDNLKTNHRGIFVLSDTRFQPLSRMSADRRAGLKANEAALRRAQTYLYFPCGVIRGALQGLGLDVAVTANATEIPSAQFQIQTKGAKA